MNEEQVYEVKEICPQCLTECIGRVAGFVHPEATEPPDEQTFCEDCDVDVEPLIVFMKPQVLSGLGMKGKQ